MSYTALLLDQESQNQLLELFQPIIPTEWERKAHHMTINLGPPQKGPAANLIGEKFEIIVETFGEDNRVLAVGVKTDCPSNNTIKHITIAVNVDGGGKPKHSNELSVWTPLKDKLVLHGIVTEL